MANQNPGKILLDQYMKPGRLSQNALARAIEVPPRRINEIILGKRAITADTAVRLGIYFGNSASYWMFLQSEYDISLAKEKIGLRLNMIRRPHGDENKPTPDARNNPPVKQPPENPHKQNIKRRIMR